jgi:hypothetical protein
VERMYVSSGSNNFTGIKAMLRLALWGPLNYLAVWDEYKKGGRGLFEIPRARERSATQPKTLESRLVITHQ